MGEMIDLTLQFCSGSLIVDIAFAFAVVIMIGYALLRGVNHED